MRLHAATIPITRVRGTGFRLPSSCRWSRIPGFFVQPTPMADAMRFLDALMEGPAIHVSVLGEKWAVLDSARLHQVTFDRDFRRLLSRHP